MSRATIAIMAVVFLAGCKDKSQNPEDLVKKTPHPEISVREAPKAIALDDLISFSKPIECEHSDRTLPFIDGLLVYGDGSPVRLGEVKVEPAYRAAFGRMKLKRDGDFTIATLPVSATWHGLHMTDLVIGMGETDAWFESYIFGEPFEEVRTTLNKLGFSIKADGSQDPPPFSEGASVELKRNGTGSELHCWF